MHTKEQRLRYGEQLRKQILLKEEKKRAETLQKRKHTQAVPNSNFTTANQRQYQQPANTNSLETRNQPLINPQTQTINRKEVFQKKLEEQAYFPFGRMGGGAPARRRDDKLKIQQQQQQQVYQPIDYSSQPISQPSQPNIQNFGPPQYYNQPYSQPYKDTSQNIPQTYQQYSQPVQYSYSQQQIPQYSPQPLQNPQYQQQYQQQYYPPPPDPQYQFQTNQNHIRQSYQSPTYVQQTKPSSQQISRREVNNQGQVELKKGARNILSYENLLPEQIDQKALKQKAAQRELLLQIEEKQRLKKEEKERIRLEDLKLEEENNRYKLEQKRKIEEQENKKRMEEEAKRQNQQKTRQMREKMEKQAAEAKKRKRMEIPQYQPPREVIKSRQNNHPVARNKRPEKEIIPQPQPEPQSEQVDYHTVQKAFNTEISRDFIQQQKQKDQERRIKDRQFNELKRNLNNMKEEVITHNQLYKLEVEKAKLEIQRMRLQKIKAEQEVMKLKEELKVKKDDKREDNYRYANTRSREDHYRLKQVQTIQDDQQLPPPKPLRPKQEEVFVKKTYSYEAKEPPKRLEETHNYKQYPVNPNIGTQFQQGLQSLYGQTVKIPVNISTDKFSMSNIDQFDIKKQSPKQQKQQYRDYQQPIEEQIEDPVRRQFRKHLSGEDQLDKFVKQPKASNKWGQMSSIDSNGTKQIEQLLRQQQQYQYPSQNPSRGESRPKSKLSNIGKQSLAGGNLGYGADGFTLQSNNNDGTYNTNVNDGTFNLMKINENNDRRLSRLRQMGIETVGQDQEIGKLDKLLEKYSN